MSYINNNKREQCNYQICFDRMDRHFRIRVHEIKDHNLPGRTTDDQTSGFGAKRDLLNCETGIVAERIEMAHFSERRPFLFGVLVLFYKNN